MDDVTAKAWLVTTMSALVVLGFTLSVGEWLAQEGVFLSASAAAVLIVWRAPKESILREGSVLAACAGVLLMLFLVSNLTRSKLIPSVATYLVSQPSYPVYGGSPYTTAPGFQRVAPVKGIPAPLAPPPRSEDDDAANLGTAGRLGTHSGNFLCIRGQRRHRLCTTGTRMYATTGGGR